MSRIAKYPINIPEGTDVTKEGKVITAKGRKGQMSYKVHDYTDVVIEDNQIKIQANEDIKGVSGSVNALTTMTHAVAGTMRSLLSNMIQGVSEGFERKLKLVGVGYRADVQGNNLVLTVGFSHPVNFSIPEGITIETPSTTEIVIKGMDKQLVGQIAANVRDVRPPEPYKGKGIRYEDERVVIKETKKK